MFAKLYFSIFAHLGKISTTYALFAFVYFCYTQTPWPVALMIAGLSAGCVAIIITMIAELLRVVYLLMHKLFVRKVQ